MNNSSLPKIIGIILLLACCFADSSALAHTPRSREAHGVIQSIDHQKRLLTLTYAREPGPQKVAWRPDTQVFRGVTPVPVTELKEGAQVTVYYHTPFFGKPFATKIICAGDN